MKVLTKKSEEQLAEAFAQLFEKSSWLFKPAIYKCSEFKGQNKQFILTGIGEDERVVAAKFLAGAEEVVVVLALNSAAHAEIRHAKFIPAYLTRPALPGWDSSFTITVQEI